MLSMQHAMLSVLINYNENTNKIDTKHLAASVYPDAIRAYSGRREYSHFEESSDGKDVSYWSFPADMKHVTQEEVEERLQKTGHLSSCIRAAAIGEETRLEVFETYNQHLPEEIYVGVKDHLIQDRVFDAFIREQIDCSGKYEDLFVVDGQVYDGKQIRSYIGEIEQYGIYYLAYELYETMGITADQEWFDMQVQSALQKEYSPELAEKIYRFMKLSPEIDGYIKTHDWTHLQDGPVKQRDYEEMYRKVLFCMLSERNVDRV